MIEEIKEYLSRPVPEAVDWHSQPWRNIQPILAWLRIAPETEFSASSEIVDDDVISLLVGEVVKEFEAGTLLTWSSKMLEDVLRAVEISIGSPDRLLKEFFKLAEQRELTPNLYEFCRSVGNTLRCMQLKKPLNLNWMTVGFTEGQCCFRYWLISLDCDLWDQQLEEKTMDVLSKSSLKFR